MKTVAITMVLVLLGFQFALACDCPHEMTQGQLEQIIIEATMNPTPDDSAAMCLGLSMCCAFTYWVAFGIYFFPCFILMLAYC